jgi:ATPase subunit of ABC transporter with duplicated ATPase domains
MTASRLSLQIVVVAAFALLLVDPSSSAAQFRGGYGAYQRMAQQSAKMMQQQYAAQQKQEKEQQEAFMKRFDTNKNGKIDGKEKGPAQKYLRSLELGKDPDKAVKSLGRPSSSRSR